MLLKRGDGLWLKQKCQGWCSKPRAALYPHLSLDLTPCFVAVRLLFASRLSSPATGPADPGTDF